MVSEPQTGAKEVGSTEITGIKLGVRAMSARGVRDREEVSAPVGGCSGVEEANVGEDRSCGVSSGHSGGQYKVIIVEGSTKSKKSGSGTLLEGVRSGVGVLESSSVVYDGVEGGGRR